MRIIALIAMTTGLHLSLLAATDCTKEDKSKWIDQTKFQADLKAEGYKIKIFKVTKGNCYEIYGTNKDGKKVEIYFNPVTAGIVKSNIR